MSAPAPQPSFSTLTPSTSAAQRMSTSQLHDWRGVSEQLGGIGRSTIFGLWKSGELASVTIGRLRFSTDNQIAEYITTLEQK